MRYPPSFSERDSRGFPWDALFGVASLLFAAFILVGFVNTQNPVSLLQLGGWLCWAFVGFARAGFFENESNEYDPEAGNRKPRFSERKLVLVSFVAAALLVTSWFFR